MEPQTILNNNLEKERLELIEKRIEIQKKRIELRKEKLNIEEILNKQKSAIDEQKLLLEKISELRYMLKDITIDQDKTFLGSEPFLKPVFEAGERDMITNKLLNLIRRL